MPMRAILFAALALLVAGCATDKPLETGCVRLADFQYPAPVVPAGRPGIESLDGDPIDRAFTARPGVAALAATTPTASDALILSGGGQWGAYGAGVIDGWSAHGRLPARVVTGVSTGALQATFAYLGKPQDAGLIDAYSIANENVLVKRHGSAFFLSHASMADTAPLKRYVQARVGGLLDEVATEYRATDRALLVGAVDGLSGRFHYFDLARMASELNGVERLDCYTAALLASAAVPIVFRQATINGKPWLDGGVRRSLFLPEMVKRIAAAKARNASARRAIVTDGHVYAIKNGPLEPEAVSALPAKLLPTVNRLRSIVFNQVEQDSLDLSAFYAQRAGLKLFYTTADGWTGYPGCKGHEAGVEDQIFDPGFMGCMIAYGRSKWSEGATPWIEMSKP